MTIKIAQNQDKQFVDVTALKQDMMATIRFMNQAGFIFVEEKEPTTTVLRFEKQLVNSSYKAPEPEKPKPEPVAVEKQPEPTKPNRVIAEASKEITSFAFSPDWKKWVSERYSIRKKAMDAGKPNPRLHLNTEEVFQVVAMLLYFQFRNHTEIAGMFLTSPCVVQMIGDQYRKGLTPRLKISHEVVFNHMQERKAFVTPMMEDIQLLQKQLRLKNQSQKK